MQCEIYVLDWRENVYTLTKCSGKRTKNHSHAQSSSQGCMHACKPSKTIPRLKTTCSHPLTPHMPYSRHTHAEHSPPFWKLGEKAMIIIQNNFQRTFDTEIHRVPRLSSLIMHPCQYTIMNLRRNFLHDDPFRVSTRCSC